ncbi:MAG: PD-(D/E)XK nuclease family protein [Patescibacteria group bacterium]
MAPKKDKFSAVWVSHSSMGDFLKCPRGYYLKNMYKDPKTGRKICTVSPALALGQAVHNTVEPLVKFPAESRMKQPLLDIFEKEWKQVSGLQGGFESPEEEADAKARGRAMIERIIANPKPLEQKAIRLKDELPSYFLSEEENIILCGKVDWIMYEPKDDSIHILDFKTGKNEESDDSLQLPIYLLLLTTLQKRKVTGASYWYLDRDDEPIVKELPTKEESLARVMEVALKVKKAREDVSFVCPRGERGCFCCQPFEKIIKGEAKYVGIGGYNRDMYLA